MNSGTRILYSRILNKGFISGFLCWLPRSIYIWGWPEGSTAETKNKDNSPNIKKMQINKTPKKDEKN